jgi:hypothetical protein
VYVGPILPTSYILSRPEAKAPRTECQTWSHVGPKWYHRRKSVSCERQTRFPNFYLITAVANSWAPYVSYIHEIFQPALTSQKASLKRMYKFTQLWQNFRYQWSSQDQIRSIVYEFTQKQNIYSSQHLHSPDSAKHCQYKHTPTHSHVFLHGLNFPHFLCILFCRRRISNLIELIPSFLF